MGFGSRTDLPDCHFACSANDRPGGPSYFRLREWRTCSAPSAANSVYRLRVYVIDIMRVSFSSPS